MAKLVVKDQEIPPPPKEYHFILNKEEAYEMASTVVWYAETHQLSRLAGMPDLVNFLRAAMVEHELSRGK